MFNAPAAPDPIATANKEDYMNDDNEMHSLELLISNPTMHVNNTKRHHPRLH